MGAHHLDPYSAQAVDAAITVHSKLGQGLLESTYCVCLAYEIRQRGLAGVLGVLGVDLLLATARSAMSSGAPGVP